MSEDSLNLMAMALGTLAKSQEAIMHKLDNLPPATLPLSSPEAVKRLEEAYVSGHNGRPKPSVNRSSPAELWAWQMGAAFREAEARIAGEAAE
ncbi:MAG: hypothetical protein P1U84_04955 [Parvibaculaceae bacterium]|nr:hypothetical protein [Parvibaculaceae bacterium]